MSTGEDLETPATEDASSAEVETKTRLDLDVQISDVGPCKKHIKVTIPRTEVEKQFQESVGTMTTRRRGSSPSETVSTPGSSLTVS